MKITLRRKIDRALKKLLVFLVWRTSGILRRLRPFNPQLLDNKKLIVIRHGGIGDLVFLSPIFAELKQRHPSLMLAIMTGYCQVYEDAPYVDKCLRYTWRNLLKCLMFDYIVCLENTIEYYDEDAKEVNAYDYFAKYFGLGRDDFSKRPILYFRSTKDSITKRFPHITTAALKIGIQPRSASPVRTPSLEFFESVILKLAAQYPAAVFFLISDTQGNSYTQSLLHRVLLKIPELQIQTTSEHEGDLRDFFTIVAMMDIIIAPDSSVVHIAAALDRPAVAIYGPFPSAIRTSYYQRTISLDAKAPCAPCFTPGHEPCRVAREMRRISSPCFDLIDTEKVLAAVQELLTKYPPEPNDLRLYLAEPVRGISATSKHRSRILDYISNTFGDIRGLIGVDLGAGGDALSPYSIAIDLKIPYAKCGLGATHIKGDTRNLCWFTDDILDYVYSSHLFEDFSANEGIKILTEWSRVLKPGGVIALLLPDQERYLSYCLIKGEKPNEHHQIKTFGIPYMIKLISKVPCLSVTLQQPLWEDDSDEYSFLLVAKKMHPESLTPTHSQ